MPRKNHRVTDLGEAGHLVPEPSQMCTTSISCVSGRTSQKYEGTLPLVSIGTGKNFLVKDTEIKVSVRADSRYRKSFDKGQPLHLIGTAS